MTRDPRIDPRPGDIVRSSAGTTYEVTSRTAQHVGYNYTHTHGRIDGASISLSSWYSSEDTVIFVAPDPTPPEPQPEAKLTLDGLRSLHHGLNQRSAECVKLMEDADESGTHDREFRLRGKAAAYAHAAELLLTEIAALENP